MDVNPMKLMTLAKEVSDNFLSSGVSLNESLRKAAEANELNPMQIRRVAEIANHDANLAMLKRSEDKNFTIDLADADAVIQQIRVSSAPLAKHASVFEVLDAVRPAFVKTAELAITDPEGDGCRQRNADLLMKKLASRVIRYRDELNSQIMGLRGELEGEMHKVANLAKEHIILNEGKLSDLFKFACGRDPEWAPIWKEVFEGIRQDMMKLGAPVDKSLINDNLEMPDSTLDIVNGGHVLAIYLDTIKNKISDEDRASKRLRLMDTFGNAVVDRMESLKTPEDFCRELLDTLDNFRKQAEAGLDGFLEFIENFAKDASIPSALTIGIPAATLGLGAAAVGTAGHIGRELKHKKNQPYNEAERLQEMIN